MGQMITSLDQSVDVCVVCQPDLWKMITFGPARMTTPRKGTKDNIGRTMLALLHHVILLSEPNPFGQC